MKNAHLMLISAVVLVIALASVAAARPKKAVKTALTCQQHALQLIKRGYAEGGMQLRRVQGPFSWNEGSLDGKGNPGLRSRVAFVVSYAWDVEFRKTNRPRTVLLIGTCNEGGPSRLRDVDRSGIVDLSDLVTVKR